MKKVIGGGVAVLMVALMGHGALAASDFNSRFVDLCVANLGQENSVCSCMAQGAASDDFSDAQREWMLAALASSEDAVAMAEAMGTRDTMSAGLLLQSGPEWCAA